jgi:deazaflavin-dependent oxidoreductase (nitroreductase family)
MRTLSAPTRHPLVSREAIGRAVGGWPIWLHRIGLGWLVGRRYAVITSIGRRSGQRRRAAVMVVREDERTGELFVIAGTLRTQWYLNIRERPAVEVWCGARRFRAQQRLLSTTEITELLGSLRREHPREARVQAAFFGWPWPASDAQIRDLAATIGGVAFQAAAGR